ncbi:MAG: DNA-binding response regulator [Spirochaetaceae bacterium]|nr:MAG: DNA-binding response regulator [Spirochaetaceae bacterium]
MTASTRVLVVDDDRKTVGLVKLYLEHEGYSVSCAYDGVTALKTARSLKPDVIVLDLMLPGIDGVEICRTLRAESDVAIVMLTARATLEDRVAGLDFGADDYVVKPFSPRELAARVRAVTRRLPHYTVFRGPQEISHAGLTLNLRTHEARSGDQKLNLTPIEFRLLTAFVRDPGRVFSREQLVEKIYGYEYEGLERTIDVHIRNVRRKLEPDPARPVYIVTVYGVGYTLAREAP